MTLHFEHMWMIPLAVIIAVATYYFTRRIIASVMLMSIVMTLSSPFIVKKDLSEKVVFLVDRSMSMQNFDLNSQITVLGELLPAGKPDILIEFAEKPLEKDLPLNITCSDIELALFHSMNKIGQNGKIYLLSDMLETRGDLNFAINELSTRNIALELIVPDYKLKNEVILSEIYVPEYLTQNQNADIDILIESASKCDARLEITNKLSGRKQIELISLDQGLNQFDFQADTSSEYLDYIINVNAESDTYKDNNTRRIKADIAPMPAVAVMGTQDEFDVIQSILESYARTVHVTDSEVPDCDLVIISDTNSEVLTEEFASDLSLNVSEGMGMLVFTGRQLLKDDLFENENFSNLLPAKLHQQNKKTSPDGSIVFIVDTSGSMQGTRLILAKGIVRSSIERLSAYDKVGIVEFYGNRKWAAPIQSAANQIDLNRAVNRLTAGGGTVILPAIEEAYYGLKNVQTASKHIVVITDGGIESADHETLLRKVRDDGINVSFVMTGPAANAGFLAEMSMYGGGKFLHCPDRFSIPEIDIKTLSGKSTSPFKKNKYAVSSPELNHILKGVDLANLPLDFSYIPAETKSTANTILQAGPNPIITGWQVGLGKVALSNANILSKERTEKLFQNICRWLYKKTYITSNIVTLNQEFEIKFCQPDYALAEKIGKINQSSHIDQIQTINLDGYFLLLSFVCFISRIVIRRLPNKAAVLAVLFICSCYACAGYPEIMKEGIDLYYSNDSGSLDKFIAAYTQSDNQSDKKYSLAWALVTSQKYSRFDDLEKVLLKSHHKDSIASLNIAYAVNGNFDSAIQLHRTLESNTNLSLDDMKSIDRQLVDIAMISRQFDSAIQYYKSNNDIPALMKIYLLKGDRDQALQLANLTSSEAFSSSELYDFCIALKQMGFNNLALQNAVVLQKRKDEWFFEVTVFIYEMYSIEGEYGKSTNIICSAIDSYTFSDKQLFELAILLEKAGKTNEAITIHKKVYQRTKAIDCLMRIAHLEQTSGNLKSSYELWRQIWNDCDEAFMLYQITPSLLDIAAKTDSLVELVIELEDKISNGNATQKEIDLLIDIYISVNDSFTPIEIVKQYYGSDTIESLSRQYQIYRKCKLYRHCSRTLNKLIEIDRPDRFRYLQQLAIIAVERLDEAAALNAVEKLKNAENQLEPEFTAGLLSMLEQYEDALKVYEELISQNPENNELWLLWAQQAAECSDSTKSMAIDQLSNLLTSESSDDRFLVAVDALLNLEAPKNVLQNAYLKTIDRIKTTPEKVYLYRLAMDILSEIDPSASHVELLLDVSCYAPQRRLAFIREAMDSLGVLSPQRLDFAMLLVYMDWQCSSRQYIKLGQKFLENGQGRLAEYLFRCNSLLNAENKGLFLTIADVYQRRSDFDSALNIILEALAMYPQDCDLLLEAASYHEILGRYDEAYKLYLKVYLPLRNTKLLDNDAQLNISKNIDLSNNYKRIAFEGMIVTANQNLPIHIEKIYQEKMAVTVESKETKTNVRQKTSNTTKEEKPSLDIDMIDVELEEIISSNSSKSKHFYRIDTIVYECSKDQAGYLYDEYSDYADIMGDSLLLQYLRAGLAHKLERKIEAQAIIKACYKTYPQNRKVEFKLKKIMEANRLYRELADIFVKTAENNAKSPHFWREITRLYYMAGDLKKSKWANSYSSGQSHYVLQLLDYLFLYTKEKNIERMKQYFRKYQIECRKKNKYYALRWNYWDRVQEDGNLKERQTAYMVLSRYTQLKPEFERYKRTIYPDRRDSKEYLIAYENCKSITSNSDYNQNTTLNGKEQE